MRANQRHLLRGRSRVVALVVALYVSVIPAQEQTPPPPTAPTPAAPGAPPDCSRWVVRETSIGMTIADVKKLNRKLKVITSHEEMWPQGPASVWWQWAEDRWKGKWVLYATDTKSDAAPVMTAIYMLREEGTTPDSLFDAMVARWGQPTVGRAVDSSRLVFGSTGGSHMAQNDQRATRWEDPVCDVVLTFVERTVTRAAPATPGTALLGVTVAAQEIETYVRLDRLSAFRAKANKALDALK